MFSVPGSEFIESYTVTRTQLPQLLSVSSVAVRLNEPGSLYYPRQNHFDLNIAGTVKASHVNIKPQIDFFNLFNSNAVITQTTQYPNITTPLTILPGRLIRLGAQIEF